MDYDESILSQPVILPDINHHDDIGRAFSTITYRKVQYTPQKGVCYSSGRYWNFCPDTLSCG